MLELKLYSRHLALILVCVSFNDTVSATDLVTSIYEFSNGTEKGENTCSFNVIFELLPHGNKGNSLRLLAMSTFVPSISGTKTGELLSCPALLLIEPILK